VTEQIWLDEPFATRWKGRDVFAKAAALQGESHRALEQRQTISFVLEDTRYFIKRHVRSTWKEVLKNLVQGRLPVVSAENERVALNRLQALGIQVPRVVAFGKRGYTPSTFESFLITEDVGQHVSLEDYCRHWREQPPDWSAKFRLLEKVARISRVMHNAGICHRDFYLCHFLRMTDGSLALIDLHRALSKEKLGRRWIIKDLGGLYFSSKDIGLSRRDLLRFVRCYTGLPLREALKQKGFWRSVVARGEKLYRKDQRQ